MKKVILFSILLMFVCSLQAETLRICVVKKTGRVLEMQSGNAPLGTLSKNAVKMGYKTKDIQEKYIDPLAYRKLMLTQRTQSEINEEKIQLEMKKLIREQAIKNLKERGEIK